jgi:hypothetical protein
MNLINGKTTYFTQLTCFGFETSSFLWRRRSSKRTVVAAFEVA